MELSEYYFLPKNEVKKIKSIKNEQFLAPEIIRDNFILVITKDKEIQKKVKKIMFFCNYEWQAWEFKYFENSLLVANGCFGENNEFGISAKENTLNGDLKKLARFLKIPFRELNYFFTRDPSNVSDFSIITGLPIIPTGPRDLESIFEEDLFLNKYKPIVIDEDSISEIKPKLKFEVPKSSFDNFFNAPIPVDNIFYLPDNKRVIVERDSMIQLYESDGSYIKDILIANYPQISINPDNTSFSCKFFHDDIFELRIYGIPSFVVLFKQKFETYFRSIFIETNIVVLIFRDRTEYWNIEKEECIKTCKFKAEVIGISQSKRWALTLKPYQMIDLVFGKNYLLEKLPLPTHGHQFNRKEDAQYISNGMVIFKYSLPDFDLQVTYPFDPLYTIELINSDETKLLVSTLKGDTYIFNLKTQKFTHKLSGHTFSINKSVLLFEQQIITSSRDGNVFLWEIDSFV